MSNPRASKATYDALRPIASPSLKYDAVSSLAKLQANGGYPNGGRSPGLNERLNGLPAAASSYNKKPLDGNFSTVGKNTIGNNNPYS